MASSCSKRYKSNDYLDTVDSSKEESFAAQVLCIEKALGKELCKLDLPEKVTHVYNPLEYADEPHSNFVQRFVTGTKYILFLGMNPGPFGMAQNGVPFGDTSMVKEWLKVEGIVGKPLNEHPKRKVYGLECPRGEVSGTRFWSLWRTVCGTPDQFFENCYVHNYCPLCYMTSTGKNVTPSAMTVHFRRSIEKLCDSSLVDIIQLLNVNVVVGVGKYAEECMRRAVSGTGLQETLKICSMPHPSPANPNTRNNWEGQAIEELKKHEILSLIENKQVTWE